ncbi:MAG: ARMT1-like domain-containing protein [Sulfurimonas sp.]|uniref:damage-control phosphatase ARMT1 family protein n=1 Tax=Sulfurimonas sp. TaxID=2022749 RepID=UPI0028CF7629|nr:ARMT1-like domain-containing protein [Sulfurimonas sp.]MDT8337960.1 ARMT1-like domain-containing protein [Sulfurimonas sp.]
MTIDEACVECIINQSAKVANALHADESLSNELISSVTKMSKTFSFDDTPPEIASYVYEKMALIARKTDLYDEVKELSTKKALSFVPLLEKELSNSKDKLLTATKIAVAGNVIDLAAEVEFDLEEELEKIFDTEFAHNDFALFEKKLQSAKRVLIVGDNVGEHIFDYIFIQTLKELYPRAEYSYMVRGNPIINDVTIKEAKEAGFEKICKVVDSGVNTPGFVYNRANSYSRELFDTADLVISKGMGNYECMSPSHRSDICFLLKVKCGVVAASLKKEVGDIVCKVV